MQKLQKEETDGEAWLSENWNLVVIMREFWSHVYPFPWCSCSIFCIYHSFLCSSSKSIRVQDLIFFMPYISKFPSKQKNRWCYSCLNTFKISVHGADVPLNQVTGRNVSKLHSTFSSLQRIRKVYVRKNTEGITVVNAWKSLRSDLLLSEGDFFVSHSFNCNQKF